MQKIFHIQWTISMAVIFLALTACSKEAPINPTENIPAAYTFPQGKSSADARIVELYQKYGSYFLYEYRDADVKWTESGTSGDAYLVTQPNPIYVEGMLDLLDDTWFKLYNDNFLKLTIPYRVFLADSVYIVFPPEKYPLTSRAISGQIAISQTNQFLADLSAEDKRAFMHSLQRNLWNGIIESGKIKFPEKFFTISRYNENATSDPADDNYFRKRGFVGDRL